MRIIMSDFENLKSQWNELKEPVAPENGSQKIVEKTVFIKRKQVLTNIILSATLIILILFFFYVTAYNSARASLGLGIMIGVLALRILLEILSIKKLNELKFDLDTISFKKKITDYYNNRIKTHYVFTPIIIIAYSVGFILLLPIFKENLSHGFYIYIISSAIVVLVGLVTLIAFQVKREISMLKTLKN